MHMEHIMLYYVIFILMGRTSRSWMKLGFYRRLGWLLDRALATLFRAV